MQVNNLRMEIAGFPINEYRILGADLEFRTLEPDGNPYPDSRSTWRRLAPGDIALHFRLNTIVGQWLTDKVTGASSTESRSANQQTRRKPIRALVRPDI
jgi:hypothetical protein